MAVASTAPAGLSADPWLSSILGRPAWKIDANLPDVVSLLSKVGNGPSFFYTRVPTNDVETLKHLQDAGFRVIDTTITLEATSSSFVGEPPKNVRFAVPKDRDAVAAVASSSFDSSRLHLDPAISTTLADRSRVDWASNFFLGERGDAMVVAEDSGEVAAFLQLLGPVAGALTIDLIAVRRSSRRLGLGAACISFAAQNIVGTERLRVGTQVANVGSLRFYERLGFSVAASEYVLHLHRA